MLPFVVASAATFCNQLSACYVDISGMNFFMHPYSRGHWTNSNILRILLNSNKAWTYGFEWPRWL